MDCLNSKISSKSIEIQVILNNYSRNSEKESKAYLGETRKG